MHPDGGDHQPSSTATEPGADQLAQQKAQNPVSRRHHYVPQTYLREWSFDGKRVWAHDTVTGAVKPLGLKSVCVEEISTGWSDRTRTTQSC